MNLSKLAGHKYALQFSGGKDSLSCLYLLKPVWKELIVLWGNPGDEFPETHAQMRWVAANVAEFHEIRGNSDKETAFPVDLLPLRASAIGRAIEPEGSNVTLQSRFDCCFRNFWVPMAQKVKELGITLVIRGQRDSEKLRAPIQVGQRDLSGAEIYLPIQDWSESDVFDYLAEVGAEVPVFYRTMKAGPKCMLCTAWLEDQVGKAAYLRDHYPDKYQEYKRRIGLIAAEVTRELDTLRDNL